MRSIQNRRKKRSNKNTYRMWQGIFTSFSNNQSTEVLNIEWLQVLFDCHKHLSQKKITSLYLKVKLMYRYNFFETQYTYSISYDLFNFNAKYRVLTLNSTVNLTWKMIVRVGHLCTMDTFVFKSFIKEVSKFTSDNTTFVN